MCSLLHVFGFIFSPPDRRSAICKLALGPGRSQFHELWPRFQRFPACEADFQGFGGSAGHLQGGAKADFAGNSRILAISWPDRPLGPAEANFASLEKLLFTKFGPFFDKFSKRKFLPDECGLDLGHSVASRKCGLALFLVWG